MNFMKRIHVGGQKTTRRAGANERKRRSLRLEMLEDRRLLTGMPELLKDINLNSGDSNPQSFVDVGGTLFFKAFDSTGDAELWKSDGTEAGTVRVKDIQPGIDSSNPAYLTNVGGTLFFTASSGLWKSDGTEAGTVLVKQFISSGPLNLTNVNGTLYFQDDGRELWKSDGTEAGTNLVLNRFTSDLTNVGGMLYFTADNGATGQELWKSDGTESGTVQVKDIRPGSIGSQPVSLINVSGTLYFSANDGVHGAELWKSDGTESGTVLVRDIKTGSADSLFYSRFAVVNGTIYFSATDSGSDYELWKSDGTEAGTVRVKDIWPGGVGSSPANLTNVNGTLFFSAQDFAGRRLWKSNGTNVGTARVKDIGPGDVDSFPEHLTNVNGTLFFSTGSSGILWKSDGTDAGTISLGIAIGNFTNISLASLNGTLFFPGIDLSSGTELWKSDGTEAGTVRVKDINLASLSSNPGGFVDVNGTIFFIANDGQRGSELWKTNGTEVGTVFVKDIKPGIDSSNAILLTNVNGTLFLFADDGASGRELWKSDGTEAGTVRVKDIQPGLGSSNPSELINVDGTLFFHANDGVSGDELWKSDGTEAGTVQVKDIQLGNEGSIPQALTNVNGTLYFTASDSDSDRELWKSDGTEAGTVRVKDIFVGPTGSNPFSLTSFHGDLYFTAADTEGDYELWKTDGTEAGTVRVKDIQLGTNGSNPSDLTDVNGTLFFQAVNNAAGWELWKSDGTASGTMLVSSQVSPGFNRMAEFTAVNGTLYFAAPSSLDGSTFDLWRSDGTESGTVHVLSVPPINNDLGEPNLQELTNVNGRLFFSASYFDEWQLWTSDGSIDGSGHGTFKIDIVPGNESSFASGLVNVKGTLYLTAFNQTTGYEPWIFDTYIPPTAPSDIALSVSEIAENQPSGTFVGRLTSTDDNYNEAFYYTLVPGAGDSDNASFSIDSDQLYSSASFDFESKSSYSLRVRTTDLSGLSFERSLTIDVTDIAESIPPVVGAFDTTVTYTENGAAVLLDTNATITDIDSLDFVDGTMTVSLIANGEDSDRLQVRNVGTAAGQIGVVGNQVFYSGNPIGTFTGGNSLETPLVVTFGVGGSKVAAQALLRNLTFSTISDSPSTLPRTVHVKLADGDGGESLPVSKTVNVTAVNDAPVIANFSGIASYTEGDAPVSLSSLTTVSDVDSADFALGQLTVRVLVNSQITDRLSIRNDGFAPGDIGITGTSVLYGNVVIGSFTGTTTLTVSLNANANPAAVQALLRNVTFHSISLAPSTLTRTISATLTDGDGGTSPTVTTLVKVIAVNGAPTIGAFDTTVTYVENGVPVLLDTNATVSDVDSPDFNGGVLSVTLTDSGENEDRLAVRNQGVAANQVGVSGNQLSFGGTSIGSFYGGTSGSDPMQIVFNTNATPAAVQAVLRNITFNNVSQNPSTIPRTVEVQLTDGDGGTSDAVTKTINVTAVNNAPVISNFSGVVSYTEGDVPVLLASTASVFDADSTDFDLGRLTVSVSANSQTTDRVSIANAGVAPGQVGVSGSNVTYGGTVIGTFTGTTTLIVTLNSNANQLAVNALVANIAFSSLSAAPSTLQRTITASMTDGDGGTSTTVTKTVQVFSTNNAPVIGAFDTTVTFIENGLPVILDTNATVSDADLVDFEDGALTVRLTANGHTDDRLEIRNQGTGPNQIGVNVDEVTFGGVVIGTFSGGTSGLDPLEILLNVSANQAAIQALVRNLTFRNVSEAPLTLVRTVELQLTDGDGGTSIPVTKLVNVTAVNDAPVISNFSGFSSYTEDELAVALAINAIVEDLDSANFDLGKLITSVTGNASLSDRITIRNDGNGLGQIGVSGSNVTYSGVVIGTFAGTTALTVTLNSAADLTAVQALLRNISFSNISGAPTTAQRTITATLSDGDGGTSLAVTTIVEVIAVNDAPVVGAFTPDITYIENAAPLLLDSNATVTDVDSLDFADGTMTISLTANGHADDRLSIRNQGSAANQIGVVGNQISYSGVIIGSFAGGTSGLTPLQITFNSAASKTAAQALVRNLTYSNVSDNPSILPRTVSLTLNDGDGGTSMPATKIINVTAVNDAPTIGGFSGSVGYTKGGPAVVLDPDATVDDPDTEYLNLGILTVSLTTNRQTTDRVEILSVGTGIDQISVLSNQVFYEGVLIGTFSGTTTLTVTLNANASKAGVQKLLRSITFRSLSATPSLLSRTVSVTLSDGTGGTSLAQTKTIDIL